LAVDLEVRGAEEVTPVLGRAQSDHFSVDSIRRFFSHVNGLPDGCWLWTASTDQGGYGKYRRMQAHRYAYELFIGDIPPGLEMDHLCRMRECVNPFHVEPVTHAENMRRFGSFYRLNPTAFLRRRVS
jgi:hypothetical protein